MPVSSGKGFKKKSGDLSSLITRSIGYCVRCGVKCECPNFPKHHNKLCKLTNSHIIGRKYSATFSLEANLQCLCYSCHRLFTDWPVAFTEWILSTIGEPEYDRLRLLANQVTKMDWEAEYERVKAVAQNCGVL